MTDSAHIAALTKQDKLNRLSAARRFRVVGGRVEKYAISVSAEEAAAALATARAREQAMVPAIGEADARGVYIGIWEPKDGDGNSLKKKFNVFAAPCNLANALEYAYTAKHVANLKNWNGYNGEDYAHDTELYAALKNDTYRGGWFIPPSDLLYGKDDNGIVTHQNNIYALQEKGALKGTFSTPEWRDGNWYWSSTAYSKDSSRVHAVRLHDGYDFHYPVDTARFTCRLVRLEPIP